MLTRRGVDVAAWWQPAGRAASGYAVYRMPAKERIPSTPSEPVHLLESSSSPAFPVFDRVALPGAALDYYQVVGLGCGGLRGAF